MDITFLAEYAAPVVVGTCLCTGYIIKNAVPDEKLSHRFIPLIMGALGVGMNVWLNHAFTPQILLGGLFSGLASTGLHQAFKNLIDKNKEE